MYVLIIEEDMWVEGFKQFRLTDPAEKKSFINVHAPKCLASYRLVLGDLKGREKNRQNLYLSHSSCQSLYRRCL